MGRNVQEEQEFQKEGQEEQAEVRKLGERQGETGVLISVLEKGQKDILEPRHSCSVW